MKGVVVIFKVARCLLSVDQLLVWSCAVIRGVVSGRTTPTPLGTPEKEAPAHLL